MKKILLDELITINDINSDGVGVGKRENGKTIFVKGAVVGDVVEVGIIKESKNYDVATVENIVTPSEWRVDCDCPAFNRCGGCVYRNISYEKELELKYNIVKNALKRIGKTNAQLEGITSDSEFDYRNKVQYPISTNKNEEFVFGYYANHTHEVVPHTSCKLQSDDFSRVASAFIEKAKELGMTAYDEKTGKGLLRHLVMRRTHDGKMSFMVVVNAKKLENWNVLLDAVRNSGVDVVSFSVNSNMKNTNVIMGERAEVMWGECGIVDELCGKRFSISPMSFYQVNRKMTEKLYNKVKEYAKLEKGETLLDLYCGIGTIGLCVANNDNTLVGVEIIPDAVKNAEYNATLNGRTEENTVFVCGDTSVGVNTVTEKFGKCDVIIVDPPRKGLSEEVINETLRAQPKRIVYVSCNPATLARDVEIYEKNGYVCESASAFDLFPRTGHVESVVCLTRRLDN
ncbi:MAG: 23S rRNA (uracil(1939)-C(5))-methyltransferase RlmD [Clostridia bacterium]|nr:23S rRNA (uracil(1939)-C(5))-methyltransferase RlmD [Clostridia bacterium]